MDPAEAPGPLLPLELMFTPAAAYRVYDMFPPEWVTQLPDGRFFVSAFYPESPWIYGFLLSFGADVAVLSPPQVQQALREAGWRHYSLFLDPDTGLVVGYYEADDARAAAAAMEDLEVIFPGLY